MSRKPQPHATREHESDEEESIEGDDSPSNVLKAIAELNKKFRSLQIKQNDQLGMLHQSLENRNELYEQLRLEILESRKETDQSVDVKLRKYQEDTLMRCRELAAEVARDESATYLSSRPTPRVINDSSEMTGSRLLLGLLAVGLAAAGVAAARTLGQDTYPGLERYTQ